jgi:predicted Zn-dependent peptidase
MSVFEKISDPALEESYYRTKHPTGLEIQVWQKPGYASSFAFFSTKYGSVDMDIVRPDGSSYQIPAGTAHFLEHKLFESEDLDAFERFSKTGASANAWTSLDHTGYLFNASGHFEENLEILLDFVRHPYFTEETVQKEQGIIGQEIRMGHDNPGRRAWQLLLEALYDNHPIRVDIAGTQESIAQITAEILYDCYHNFYDLHNMILTVAGNADPETVLKIADKVLGTESVEGSMQVRKRVSDFAAAPKQLSGGANGSRDAQVHFRLQRNPRRPAPHPARIHDHGYYLRGADWRDLAII